MKVTKTFSWTFFMRCFQFFGTFLGSLLSRGAVMIAGLSLASTALAAPITYVLSGTANGSLYSTPVTATSLVQPFTSAAVTVTAISDTSSVQTLPSLPTDSVLRAFNQSLTINVSGLGAFNLLLPTFSTTEFVGVGSLRDILIRMPNNSLFGASIAPSSYNLQGSLAPLSAAMFNSLTVVGTDRGNLHLTFLSEGSFSATMSAVPLPSTVSMMLLAMFVMVGFIRKTPTC
jgi:hypothetical protein